MGIVVRQTNRISGLNIEMYIFMPDGNDIHNLTCMVHVILIVLYGNDTCAVRDEDKAGEK